MERWNTANSTCKRKFFAQVRVYMGLKPAYKIKNKNWEVRWHTPKQYSGGPSIMKVILGPQMVQYTMAVSGIFLDSPSNTWYFLVLCQELNVDLCTGIEGCLP